MSGPNQICLKIKKKFCFQSLKCIFLSAISLSWLNHWRYSCMIESSSMIKSFSMIESFPIALECVLAVVTNNCFWRHNQNGNRAYNSVIVQSEQQNHRPTTETVFGWGRQNALLIAIPARWFFSIVERHPGKEKGAFLGSISQSNKTHRKSNCQYHQSDLYCDITLYLATAIDLQLISILIFFVKSTSAHRFKIDRNCKSIIVAK